MIEKPLISSEQELKEALLSKKAELAKSMEGKIFEFTDIETGYYEDLKKEDAELPGYSTPIDDIIKKLKEEGMKAVLSKGGGDIMILPADSNDTMGSIRPKHLKIVDGMDSDLKEIIQIGKDA